MSITKQEARDILLRAFENTGVTTEQALLLVEVSEAALRGRKKPWFKKLFDF